MNENSKMKIQPNVLGYFILPHDGKEGFASLSLEDLLDSYGSELEFPFLNHDRLKHLKCHPGVQRKTINDIDATGFKDNVGWSPASRFLYQMSKNGMEDKLGILSNKLIITTSRRTIIEIIKFGQAGNGRDLTLKTQLKIEKYGKRLKVAYVNQASYDYFWRKKQNNSLFGLKFGLYLTKDDHRSMKTDATLFSIHCLQIDDVCFIYEAEIDAIQHTQNPTSNESMFSIIEIKTCNKKEEIMKAFKIYAECYTTNYSRSQVGSSLNELEDMFVSLRLGLPFYQGELGNVQKFIYGFHEAHNQSALSSISAEEFDCYPEMFLTRDAAHLLDFVGLLKDSGILSPSYKLAWDKWDSWKLKKEENSVKLEKDGETIGNIDKRERV